MGVFILQDDVEVLKIVGRSVFCCRVTTSYVRISIELLYFGVDGKMREELMADEKVFISRVVIVDPVISLFCCLLTKTMYSDPIIVLPS